MELQVRDRVYVTDSLGVKVGEGTIININDFREPEMKYAVDLDDYSNNPLFMDESRIIRIQGEF